MKVATISTKSETSQSAERQRELGAFYTHGNPFVFEKFHSWFSQIESDATFAEPFCGSGQIIALLAKAGFHREFSSFDIDDRIPAVEHRNSLKNFPSGFDVVITNPPYLSINFAKRKGVDLSLQEFAGYSSLYQVAIELSLKESRFVAMIIPESFITSGLFHERLQAVISLPFKMFQDTDMPTCLALWGPNSTDSFQIFRQNVLLGKSSDLLVGLRGSPCGSRIHFNRPDGNLGLRAIDNSFEASIRFCAPEEIPVSKVKTTARLLTRIQVDELRNPSRLISLANDRLNQWRVASSDVNLTAFKGLRKDGVFRRRLDFASARALLSEAICLLEKHDHAFGGENEVIRS